MRWRLGRDSLWRWLSGACVALSLLAVVALLALIAVRGLAHFWPADIERLTLENGHQVAGILRGGEAESRRYFTANRDLDGQVWRWIAVGSIVERETPASLVYVQRRDWGPFIGRLAAVTTPAGERLRGDAAESRLHQALAGDAKLATLSLHNVEGRDVTLPFAQVQSLAWPNRMHVGDKLLAWLDGVWRFLSEAPGDGRVEGGVWPAIFGTLLMVILMSLVVTPFGVLAALYLNEVARQGPVTRLVRIAVRNLAGVPSIVYGVFGLGVFVYGLGGQIDRWFYAEALPSPTFGTGGLLWASLTLALLTLPVVIVATEEGLARVPGTLREGSLALGATRFETLKRVVVPMALPSMLTGVILAVARAAGEVAPLMLVGVAKLAPEIPLDGEFPFLHLESKFMHLGYHVFDLGFASRDAEAAMPLVFATATLLVAVIVVLNLTAILLRHHLRARHRALERS
ncbi:phosphate ABC transporter permease PstA [Chromohalobacter israelensis]|uniref:phosphate ABC transporter permease PstA n=1 Tax=Chromohalobacter israelensis TaxID=141390 RepID=UPI003D79CB3A